MYIGLVIYGSLDTISGGYLYDRELVAHLQRQGEQVEVISLPWRSYPHHLADNFSTALLRRLAGEPFDLLLEDELNHPSLALLNHRLKKLARYPVISIVHHLRISERHPPLPRALYRTVECRYLASCDGFIFNSQTTRAVVESLVGGTRPSVVAYPAGSRLRATPPEPGQISARLAGADRLRIVFVGSLIPRKGLHTLLDGLALLPSRGWHLDVVGSPAADPAYARRIQRRIQSLGIGGRVSLHGPLPDPDLHALLMNSHLLCVPSSYEGFGIVYLEGMACGLPAIATTAGAAHEIVEDGVTGFLVPPEDPAVLSRRLNDLLTDRGRLFKMSLTASERFASHPTWEQTTARIHRFLRSWAGDLDRLPDL
ncbi:MAG: hypothetical protein Kow00124_21240 [Anaerolineae bacterium]